MSLWEPYVTSILGALDGMPGEAEVDLSLLVSVQSLQQSFTVAVTAGILLSFITNIGYGRSSGFYS